MQPSPPTVSPETPPTEISETFGRLRGKGFPVVDDDGSLWGIVTVEDLDRAVTQNSPRETPVASFGTPRSRLLVAYLDEPMGSALGRLSARGLGHLPVMDRSQPTRLVGLSGERTLSGPTASPWRGERSCSIGAKRMQLRDIDGTEFVEIVLTEGDRAVGKSIQEVAKEMPSDCILVSIRRGGRILIPHGDTFLQAGDRVTAFAESRRAEALRRGLSRGTG
jgi:CIC family chloride channel protein